MDLTISHAAYKRRRVWSQNPHSAHTSFMAARPIRPGRVSNPFGQGSNIGAGTRNTMDYLRFLTNHMSKGSSSYCVEDSHQSVRCD